MRAVLDFFFFCGAHIGYPISISFNKYFNKFLLNFLRTTLPIVGRKSSDTIFLIPRIPVFDVARILNALRCACSFVHIATVRRLCFYSSYVHTSFFMKYSCSTLFRFTDSSYVATKWICGAFTNYYVCFFSVIQELYLYHELLFVGRPIYFLTLFFRIAFFSYFQAKVCCTLSEYMHVVQKYWHMLVFLRFFKVFYRLPQVFIATAFVAMDASIQEVSTLNLPTIGIMDSSSVPTTATYLIPSNVSSGLLILFYFHTFLFSSQLVQHQQYTQLYIV